MAVSAASARSVTPSRPAPPPLPMGITPSRAPPSPPRRSSAPDLASPTQSSKPHPPITPPSLTQPSQPPNPATALSLTSASEDDTLVPTVFTWNYGGHSVFITGAWDNWQAKTPMYKNGNEFLALIYVPVGEHQFKFFVDDNWQCAPNLDTRTDDHGNTNNVVYIVAHDPEFDCAAPLHANDPPSPLSSYDQMSTADFPVEPPVLPPHLEMRALKPLPDDISPAVSAGRGDRDRKGSRPFTSHVYLDHLYKEKGVEIAPIGQDDVRSLSQTTRVGRKLVHTVFVTRTALPLEPHPDGNGFAHFSAT